MRAAFLLLLVIHAVIHILGFLKAFNLAPVAALPKAISQPAGALWLFTTLALLGAAALWIARSSSWVWPMAVGILVSQALILTAWSEAKWGTLANLVLAVPVVLSLLDRRASSFTSQYHAEVARRSAEALLQPTSPIAEGDLAQLPPAVQRYLKRVGAVGHLRPRTLRAHFVGRMRKAVDQGWMDVDVDQFNTFGPNAARLFLLNATRFGVPIHVYHRYVESGAQMSVRLLGLFPLLHVAGPEMTRAETVTVLNDLCLLAPGALLNANVRWESLGENAARATYTQGRHTVSALLEVDASGSLTNFTSQDRYQSDEKGHRLVRWSTPVQDYRAFGNVTLAARGDAQWGEPGSEWTYAEFHLQRVEYDVAP